jgi:phosphoribosyl-ATP pyrophosphohydrolase
VIIPSVDLMGGRAVQLEGGDPKALRVDGGDPRPIAERFGRVGEVAVIDLDAALSHGSNAGVIEELLRIAPCRVGGGIRSVDAAIRWLDAGAAKIILGTAATPEVLRELPRDRVIAALDARDGQVVDRGWTRGTGAGVAEKIEQLREFVGGFLVTFVEVEGSMKGLPIERVADLKSRCGDARLTVAGGVRDAAEIAALDAMGVDCQVGMALYTGRITLADAIGACLTSDRPDGLWATVVVDESGEALGLAWSNAESLKAAIEEGAGVYFSRRRGLWRKGESSGQTQELLRVDMDCDRDCLRFTVRQRGTGAFCHTGTRSCWGNATGLRELARRLADPATAARPGSYTARLLADPALLGSKLREEARELSEAQGRDEVVHEAADVLYFTLARLAQAGVPLAEVERELERRSRKVTRRRGDAKGD